MIDPSANGSVDPGWVTLNAGDSVTQTFVMPTSSQCGPYAVRASGISPSCVFHPANCGVAVNGSFANFSFGPSGADDRVCLGDWGYGDASGNATFVVTPWPDTASFPVYLDHLGIEPAPDCPMPGEVVDPNFDGDGGWVWLGGATLVSGGGVDGGNAVEFSASSQCDYASINGTVSIPTASNLPQSALQLDFRGNVGSPLAVAFGQSAVFDQADAVLVADGTQQSLSICIPEWAKGRITSVEFQMQLIGDQTCATPWNQDVVISNPRMVSDASCPAQSFLENGDFESTGPVQWWQMLDITNTGATPTIDNDPLHAHGGTHSLHMRNTDVCTQGTAYASLTVPAANGSSGPALFFWYDTSAAGAGHLSIGSQLPVSSGWQQGKLCLDPSLEGLSSGITIEMSGVGGVCGQPALGDAWVDDLTVGTDPSCTP